MNSVDIESSSNLSPVSALKKIQIKPLKRQRSSPKPKPKPKLPYKKPYLFLNQNYEPDLELLTNDIHISLKNFKSMEDDALAKRLAEVEA
jgi:hypothetical protein